MGTDSPRIAGLGCSTREGDGRRAESSPGTECPNAAYSRESASARGRRDRACSTLERGGPGRLTHLPGPPGASLVRRGRAAPPGSLLAAAPAASGRALFGAALGLGRRRLGLRGRLGGRRGLARGRLLG